MKKFIITFRQHMTEKTISAERFRYIENMVEFYTGKTPNFEIVASFPKDNIAAIEVENA